MLHQSKRSKSSGSNEWWTDHDLFWELCDEYNFYPEIDVAATEANSLCRRFFTKKDNALKRNWIIGKKKRKCFCNPPNKEMGKFLEKTYQQFKDLRIQTMFIVPLNIQSSKAFWNSVQIPMEKGEKILCRPIRGRRKFLFRGRDLGTSINGYCIIIFGRRNRIGIRV